MMFSSEKDSPEEQKSFIRVLRDSVLSEFLVNETHEVNKTDEINRSLILLLCIFLILNKDSLRHRQSSHMSKLSVISFLIYVNH